MESFSVSDNNDQRSIISNESFSSQLHDNEFTNEFEEINEKSSDSKMSKVPFLRLQATMARQTVPKSSSFYLQKNKGKL